MWSFNDEVCMGRKKGKIKTKLIPVYMKANSKQKSETKTKSKKYTCYFYFNM